MIRTDQTIEEMTPADLDKQVAKAEGITLVYDSDCDKNMYVAHPRLSPREWSPTKFWSQAGPLIEKYKIDLNWEWEKENNWTASTEPDINVHGETLLVAAMRAIVLKCSRHDKPQKS